MRYVWSYALLRMVTEKKRGFERPVAALGAIPTSSAMLRDHLGALSRSIKAVGICSVCSGECCERPHRICSECKRSGSHRSFW